MREFNITGLCVKHKHYMVDISKKLEKIIELIGRGKYFTINRARQYGKTTTLSLINNILKDKYIVVKMSFEGVGDSFFDNKKAFCEGFIRLMQKALKASKANEDYISAWGNSDVVDFESLSTHITNMCENKKIILMIDEVDRTSNNTVFINFLGVLRDKYLSREEGTDTTFHSVILAGVYDIKNIKQKIKSEGGSAEGQRIYNSPWNIATDFKVDMSFNPEEISTMLIDYENDYHTGMDITAISEEIYKYTSGYPFLVSKICKLIDEDLDKAWTPEGVQGAVKNLLDDKNTLFDDMFKNIENNEKLYDLIFAIILQGEEIPFDFENPEIDLGNTFGILKNKDRKVAVSNEIYEIRIYNYLIVKQIIEQKTKPLVIVSDVVKNNKFDMALCLTKFSQHYYEIFNQRDAQFYEKHGRLLFLSYLKPLINGIGFYHIEAQTRNERRMDIVLDYEKDQFIIELKLWRGEKTHEDAYEQLWQYLNSKNLSTGYLLTFDFRKNVTKELKAEWVKYNGKQIFDCVV